MGLSYKPLALRGYTLRSLPLASEKSNDYKNDFGENPD
jgi:hypothetical protein